MLLVNMDLGALPLESEVKENKKDARGIASFVSCTRVLRDAARQSARGDEAPKCAHHEHPST